MSVNKRESMEHGRKVTKWRVRWKDGEQWGSRTFDAKKDADLFDADVKRRKALGEVAQLGAGTVTLDTYVRDSWGPNHVATLAARTRTTYTAIYGLHVGPQLGRLPIREITPPKVKAWQSERARAGAGEPTIRKAKAILSGILQSAVEDGVIGVNAARQVTGRRQPDRPSVRPFAPVTVEAMRRAVGPRDAALVSVLAYAGLRPEEALALRWGDVRENIIRVERAADADGTAKATKTGRARSVKLLTPLAHDLREWRMQSGRPAAGALVFPNAAGGMCTEDTYRTWRRTTFRTALAAATRADDHDPLDYACPACHAQAGQLCQSKAGKARKTHRDVMHLARTRAGVTGRPYDLRHSFASLLLHEGRTIVYVAQQLGDRPEVAVGTYTHVIDELEDSPRLSAEDAIRAARAGSVAPQLPMVAV